MDFIQFARCRERYRNLNQIGTHKINYLYISLLFGKNIKLIECLGNLNTLFRNVVKSIKCTLLEKYIFGLEVSKFNQRQIYLLNH